ncbi:MAG: c-type cytochrome, partial [Gammaproteobacteria bacterium]
PALAGQHDWYTVRQLQYFKDGIRGTASGDTFGAQMRPMAMTLADEQAMKDVAAYINTLK